MVRDQKLKLIEPVGQVTEQTHGAGTRPMHTETEVISF